MSVVRRRDILRINIEDTKNEAKFFPIRYHHCGNDDVFCRPWWTSIHSFGKVSLNELYDAIDRASLLTSEAEKNTIKLEIKDSIGVISSNIPEIGNVKEQIHILTENDQEFVIAFSSKYMMDAIRTLNSEFVTLSFNSEVQPIIIRNPEDLNLTQLIVPIKIY